LSNNIIQKGLAFGRDWSGTVGQSGRQGDPRSCPAGLLAEVGLRWWRRDVARNRTEDLNVKNREVKACREATGCAIGDTRSDVKSRCTHHWRSQE